MSSPTTLPPLPRRHSSTLPVPILSSLDPRLQNKPRHMLGPWALSRKISSGSSSNSPSLRSRAGSVVSPRNGLSHSPDREGENSLEGIHGTCETRMTHTPKHGACEAGENHIPRVGVKGEDEDEDDVAMGINVGGPPHPANTQQPEFNTNAEQALKRDIFSIHNALEHKSSPSSTTNSNSTTSQNSTTLSSFPTTTSLHINLSLDLFPYKLHGTVQTRTAHEVTLTLKLSLDDSPQDAGQYPSAIPFAFSHLRPGDEVTLLTGLSNINANADTSTKAGASQGVQTSTDDTGIAWPSYTTETADDTQYPHLSLHSFPTTLRYLTTTLYILSIILLLAFPPTIFFILNPSFAPATPSRSLTTDVPRIVFMTMLLLNAFNIGVLFWIAGSWMVLWGRRKKGLGKEEGGDDDDSRVIQPEPEPESESESESGSVSPTMKWTFGALSAGLLYVSWCAPWVMSILDLAE